MELATPAGSLAQVHECVREAIMNLTQNGIEYSQRTGTKIELPSGDKAPPFWFRGHEQSKFKLIPNILRTGNEVTNDRHYLREETRSVQFPARVAHLVKSDRLNGIEWQEITQHYGSKTRLLDWTESLYVALTIALEPHLANPSDARFTQRALDGTAPHIWVLSPTLLNLKLYSFILNNDALVKNALAEFRTPFMYGGVRGFRKKLGNIERYILDPSYANSGIISLSALENLRIATGSRLPNLLRLGEFNPYFYMLLRIFNDRVNCSEHIPPLAILHPYHSSRIEKQRGAFTVFALPPDIKKADRPIAPAPMEQYNFLHDCMVKINLVNLSNLSDEMLRVGQTRSELYPEIATYAEELEWGAN